MADEPELSKGQSSEWATYLQQLLAVAGYWNGGETGEFDDALEQAVIQFQQAAGLTADGVVRSDTWDALTGGGGGGGGGGGQTESDTYFEGLDPNEYPEIIALSQMTWEEYVQNVMGLDPAEFQTDDDQPVA